MDEIRIRDLQIYAYHGVLPEENRKGQNFFINAVLRLPTRTAGLTDDLALSVNYADVCIFMDHFMREHTFQLLEAVAERMSQAILIRFPLIQEITLEIRKPEAPIPLAFQSVSVCITRSWHRAYIAFGSNMGDKQKYILQAIEQIKQKDTMRLQKVSDIIETTPYGGVEQDGFLNGVMEADTLLTPLELLDYLHELEQQAQRVRDIRWGPRTLDLDIIFYDHEVMDTDTLIIPHVDMKNRDFVLVPMVQLNRYYEHPVFHVTVEEMLARLRETNEKHVLSFENDGL